MSMVVNHKKVTIFGVGYVGEHLLQAFKEHYEVTGVDTNSNRIQTLRTVYPDACFQSTPSNLETSGTFLVCVPTLVHNGDVDLSSLKAVRDTLLEIAQPGSLIVVESSVYVGATRELFSLFLERGVYVGMSPERVDPGRSSPTLQQIPKIVSGLNEVSLTLIKQKYAPVFETLVPVSSTECAEMSKLYENCFRMVNIAYVNEISDLCGKYSIDSKEMISASSTKPFGFMPFQPGLGVGGHCIPVNPYYLLRNGASLPVLEKSLTLMEQRPREKARELLTEHPTAKNVLVCGIGFKRGQSLLTNSPGYALYKELTKTCNVTVYDPVVEKTRGDSDAIRFLRSENCCIEYLQEHFDLIVVNYTSSKEISMFEERGGKVVWF
jgi:nucleotide sugar dehydrogenase